MRDANGKLATLLLPHRIRRRQLAGWRGGSGDGNAVRGLGDEPGYSGGCGWRTRSARTWGMWAVAGSSGAAGWRSGPGGLPISASRISSGRLRRRISVRKGLPLIKPPWGRITAIDLNTGEHVWMAPNGDAPDYVKNHPAAEGHRSEQGGQADAVAADGDEDAAVRRGGSDLFNARQAAAGKCSARSTRKPGR